MSGRSAARFPRACVATPHYLASSAGLAVLAGGGNALDAAVAANLTLGVVAPYLCGYGGDLFALVWDGSRLHGYNGSGRAPAAATPEALRRAAAGHVGPLGPGGVPERGPLPVTVPGAVDGWFALLDRFGTRSFAELSERALGYARDGFPLTAAGAASIADAAASLPAGDPAFAAWRRVYAGAGEAGVLVQPELARTIGTLARSGRDAFYRGEIAQAVVGATAELGGLLGPGDLAEHLGEWVTPLSTIYRERVEVFEMPPNTQGVTALEALNVVEALGSLPADGPDRHHLLVEAVKLALADRRHVTDPAFMTADPARLASRAWGAARAATVDPGSALDHGPGDPAGGGTAYVCAADADGMLVSLIQSNYEGFGSGVTVPGWGINLHNRGSFFFLDPAHPNAVAPRKRTMHTLIPAMAFRDGAPWLAFGTMGGDGQAQTHLQLLTRIVDDGEDLQRAVDAPRWYVDPADWGVTAESRLPDEVVGGLRALGHRLSTTGPFDSLMGHAHAVALDAGGYAAATDPRAEGAALGL